MPIKNYQKYLIVAIPVLLIGLAIYYFSDIFTYVVLGWVISLLGRPLFKLFNKGLSSQVSALLTLACFTIIISLFMWILVPRVIKQTRNLANIDYEVIKDNLDEPLQDWNDWLVSKGILEESTPTTDVIIGKEETIPEYDIVRTDTTASGVINVYIDLGQEKDKTEETTSFVFNNTDSFVDSVKDKIFDFFNPSQLPSLFGSIAGFFGNVLITILSAYFIAFFFLKESGLFTKIINSVMPDDKEDQANHALDDSENLLTRYFIGIALQVTVITIFMSIALGVLGFENALLIAFMAGLINVIPFIGPVLGATFGIIITISSNIDVSFYNELLPMLIKLVAVFGVMQLFDNFILQPNIFSKSVKSHPLEIFIVILVGAKLGGVLGMILAIPTYTVLRVIAKVFLSEFKIVQNITRGM